MKKSRSSHFVWGWNCPLRCFSPWVTETSGKKHVSSLFFTIQNKYSTQRNMFIRVLSLWREIFSAEKYFHHFLSFKKATHFLCKDIFLSVLNHHGVKYSQQMGYSTSFFTSFRQEITGVGLPSALKKVFFVLFNECNKCNKWFI